MEKQNPNQQIKIDKITINFGAGKEPAQLKKGEKLLKTLTGKNPIQTLSKKRIPTWGLRLGLPIGCKVTIRGEEAKAQLKTFLAAKENMLVESQYQPGAVSFGIKEYVDVPGAKYDPEIGIVGFEVCVNLKKAGYRIERRHLKKSKMSPHHKITKQETIDFINKEFNVKIGEKE